MRPVGIFRLRYPVVSETFIREQAAAMTRHHPTVITRTVVSDAGGTGADTIVVGGRSRGVARHAVRAAYMMTGSPRLFGPRTIWPPLALVHAHFGPDATYALPLAEHLGVPLVTTFHGWDVTLPARSYLGRTSLTTWRYVACTGALQQRGTAFIAVSDYIRGRLIALGYPPDRIVRLYVGVDVDRFQPSADRPSERFVLSVARHTHQKGVDTLIRAFARVAARIPDVKLVQVGTGPLTAELRQLVERHGLARRVQFAGPLPHDAVRSLMAHAAVVALTSQTPPNGQQEALGLVLNEAGASGVPVVATRHGGMPEAVLDGETGLILPERDERGIAEALETILTDRALAVRMGQRGRAFVGDVFNLRAQTSALEDLYEAITDPARARTARSRDRRDAAPRPVS